jgi:hypothetical protein
MSRAHCKHAQLKSLPYASFLDCAGGSAIAAEAPLPPLPLGNTLRTDVQSTQRLDQAKFQIKAVDKAHNFFLYKIRKGSAAIFRARSRDVAMVDGRRIGAVVGGGAGGANASRKRAAERGRPLK